MAMTATISVSPSTVVTEQKATAILTISNSAAYPVAITAVQGYARLTGSVASNYNAGVTVGSVNTGPNAVLTVGASSSLVLTFELRFHGPSTGYSGTGTSTTFDVSASIQSDDGSIFAPTAATVTVNYAVDL